MALVPPNHFSRKLFRITTSFADPICPVRQKALAQTSQMGPPSGLFGFRCSPHHIGSMTELQTPTGPGRGISPRGLGLLRVLFFQILKDLIKFFLIF